MVGVLIAYFVRQPRFISQLKQLLPIGIVVLGCVEIFFLYRGWEFLHWVNLIFGLSLHELLFGSILLHVVIAPETWQWLGEGSFPMFGRYSYCAYLIHMPIATFSGVAMTYLHLPIALYKPLGLILTFGIAAVSWRFLEAPLLAIGKRYRYTTEKEKENLAPIGKKNPIVEVPS